LPVKGLMDLFGIELADLISTKKIAGVRTAGDDLILNPEQILPPPHIEGRVTQIRIEGDRIVQSFGNGSVQTSEPGNYMAYRDSPQPLGQIANALPPRPPRAHRCRLSLARDPHHFEVTAAQQRGNTDKGTRRKVFCESSLISLIEFPIEIEVGAKDLNIGQVI